MKRFLAVSAVVIVILLIGGFVWMRSYLRSPGIARQVSERLADAYGGPAEVENVEVGARHTTLRGITLYEEDAQEDAEPWLKIDTATADVSLIDLVRGNVIPPSLSVQGATLLLHFDAEGTLITRFPQTTSDADVITVDQVPEMTLEKVLVIFRKAGCPDLKAHNATIKVAKKNGEVTLTGSGDSDICKLALSGTMTSASPDMTVTIKTAERPHVKRQTLECLPWVPAEVWRQVNIAQADSTAELTLRYDQQAKDFHYRLELNPTKAQVHVPEMALDATDAQGTIIVDDHLVQLRDIRGNSFGGTVRLDGELDFRGSATKITMSKIDVENLDVKGLPEEWSIPPFVRKNIANGKLSGSARLGMTVHKRMLTVEDADDLASFAGLAYAVDFGNWAAPVAWLAAFPKYDFEAKSKGKAKVHDPTGKFGSIEFDWRLAPRRARPEAETKTSAVFNPALLLFGLVHVEEQQPKEQKPATPTYLDFNLELKDINVGEVIKNLEIKLPFEIGGKGSVKLKASLPTDRFNEWKYYKAEGTVQLTDLVLPGVQLKQLDGDVVLREGVLHFKSVRGSVGAKGDGGTLAGSGQIEIDPLGMLIANLAVERISIAQIANLKKEEVQGTFSGNLALRAPVEKLNQIEVIAADGKITSDRVAFQDMFVTDLASTIKLAAGVLELPDFRAKYEGTPIGASVTMQLDKDRAFKADLDLKPIDLVAINKLTGGRVAIRGDFATSVALRGKLEPFSVMLSGQARADAIQLDTFTAQKVRFHWKTDQKTLDLSQVEATLYGGKATGTAVVPIDPKATGKMDLQIEGLNSQQLAKDLKLPFRMAGEVGGVLKGDIAPGKNAKEPAVKLNLDLKAPKLRVQNIPTEQLHGTIDYRTDHFDYKLKGKSLGGTFDLSGQFPVPGAKPAPAEQEPREGRLQIRGVHVGRLLDALDMGDTEYFRGRASVDFTFTQAPGETRPRGRGMIRVLGLGWKDRTFADVLQGELVLSDQRLRIRDFRGNVAGGTFNFQMSQHLRYPELSWIALSMTGIQAGTLLAPWTGDAIEGTLQGRLRGSFSDGWQGSGDLELTNAKVVGVTVNQWRLPVNWTHIPGQGHTRIQIAETTAQVARGRVTGKVDFAWDGAARVDGRLTLARVDLQEVLKQTVGPTQVTGGDVTGRIDFNGSGMRKLSDLRAQIALVFKQTQAMQIPVLQQVAPFIGAGQSTTFQSGDLVAKLDGGILRIQRMSLIGTNAQVFLDGNMTLEGRLNLDVLARTGNVGLPTDRLRLLGLKIPAAGPIPIGVILEVSSLLSNRIAYLQVSGTVRNPIVRPRAAPILAQEAVRFFLGRYGVPSEFAPQLR